MQLQPHLSPIIKEEEKIKTLRKIFFSNLEIWRPYHILEILCYFIESVTDRQTDRQTNLSLRYCTLVQMTGA